MTVSKRHRPGHTEKELVTAIRAAYWLSESDRGAIAVARDLAAQIDRLKRSEPSQTSLLETETQKAGKIAYVSAQLQRLMRDLGLTAAGRRDLGFAQDESEVNPLDDLRGSVPHLEVVRGAEAEDRDAADAGS